MDNFNFYSPTEFVFGKDREIECGKYVKKFGLGADGRTGGFVSLSSEDVANIYKIAAHATV